LFNKGGKYLEEEIKRASGGQPGNQNARTHGFYSCNLEELEQRDFALAAQFDGIDEEITVLRVKLKAVIENDPNNIRLIVHICESIAKLLRTKLKLGTYDKQSSMEAIKNVLREVALPLGIGINVGKSIFK
jgi:hypothetical protein